MWDGPSPDTCAGVYGAYLRYNNPHKTSLYLAAGLYPRNAGILRGGGDTKFLMIADIAFQILASIPLGYLVGVVWQWPVFWVLIALRIDYIIKSVWLIGRLRSGKWIHKAKSMA